MSRSDFRRPSPWTHRLVRHCSWLLGLLALGTDAVAECPVPAGATPLPGTDLAMSIALPGLQNDPVYGAKLVYIHVPAAYQVGRPIPLVVVLHGASGSQTGASGQASILRGLWRPASDAGGFIVASLIASGSNGGWIAPGDRDDAPTDYDLIEAVVTRLSQDYSIDATRRYLWGFSSGGHVTLDIALNEVHPRIHSGFFAGYGVSAGASRGLACAGLGTAECVRTFSEAPIKRPIDVHIGNADNLIAQVLDDRSRFLGLGWRDGVTFFWQEFDGGHYVLNEHPLQTWNNLCGFSTRAPAMPRHEPTPAPFTVTGAAVTTIGSAVPDRDPGLQPPDRKR